MFVFACCWEGKKLEQKIHNCLELDYPSNKLEILAVSDGATAQTLAVLEKAKRKGRIKVLINPERSGKGVALALAHAQCTSDIFVVTDADTMLQPHHLKELVAPFLDKKVGATTGTFYYGNLKQSGISRNEGLYWRLEVFTRKAESLLGRSITVTGAIYAIRTSIFNPNDPRIPDDFLAGVQALEQGKKVFFLDKLVTCDYSATSAGAMFRRRVRTITRGLSFLLRNPRYIFFIPYPFLSFQLWSHKMLRYLLPVWMLLILASNAVLAVSSPFWLALLCCQILFYLGGLLGGVASWKQKKIPILTSIWYLMVAAWASLAAIFNVIRGKDYVTWGQTAQR